MVIPSNAPIEIQQKALDLFREAKDYKMEITIYESKYLPDHHKKALYVLENAMMYCKNLGGELKSRQVIAGIIACAEQS